MQIAISLITGPFSALSIRPKLSIPQLGSGNSEASTQELSLEQFVKTGPSMVRSEKRPLHRLD
jgi:hypothetical protein